MRKKIYLFVAFFATLVSGYAQVSGNLQYNENNRFEQSQSYKQGKSKAMAAPVSAGYNYNQGAQPNYADNAMMSQITNTWSTYASGNEHVVKVNILYNATPQNFTAIFHINQAGKKVAELDSLLQQRVNKFVGLASKIGVKKDHFYLDMIALVPIFDREKRTFSKSYIQVPKGFEMQKNIHVRYHDPAQLDQLYSMAAQCEIYDLIKVEYQYDSTEFAHSVIREKANAVLQKKLKMLANMGIKLDTCYRTMTEQQNQSFPTDQYVSYQPLAVSTIDDEGSSDATKIATNSISRSTLFYNQLSSDGFDAIINPSPLKPGLQFVYSLEVKYRRVAPVNTVVKYEKGADTKEVYLVTPQGTIKEIPIK